MPTRAPAKPKPRKRGKKLLEDAQGRRAWVVLPIEEYDELLEAAEQAADIRYLREAEQVQGEPIPWERAKARLRKQAKRS